MKKKQYSLENKEHSYKILATLLYIINTEKDIFFLLDLGCDVAQIPLLLQRAKEDGYIYRKDGKLCLTKLGETKLTEYRGLVPKNKKNIIAPLHEAKIRSIPLNAIYLPEQIGQYRRREKG